MTEYYVQNTLGAKYGFISCYHKSLKSAKHEFDKLCESFPKENFKIVRKITTEEVVCQSEDVRQARFDFV